MSLTYRLSAIIICSGSLSTKRNDSTLLLCFCFSLLASPLSRSLFLSSGNYLHTTLCTSCRWLEEYDSFAIPRIFGKHFADRPGVRKEEQHKIVAKLSWKSSRGFFFFFFQSNFCHSPRPVVDVALTRKSSEALDDFLRISSGSLRNSIVIIHSPNYARDSSMIPLVIV